MDKFHFSSLFTDKLPRGGFLTVAQEGKLNTMTIAWGSIGFIWQKAIVIALVRPSRYTFDMLSDADNFSLSFPYDNSMRKELAAVGSKSGRDLNKFEEFNLKTKPSHSISSPVIEGCELYYECRVLVKQALEQENFPEEIQATFYPQGDYHVLFFGEIITSYKA